MIEGPAPGTWWVEAGRLLVGPYPSDLDRLAGIDVFLDLTHETDGLPGYANALQAGVRTARRPVRDFTAPTAQQMIETLDLLQLELDGGNAVYLHCRGGIGRTGTTLGCHLVRNGRTPAEALAELAGIGKGPESDDQSKQVEEWPRLDRPGRLTRGSRIQVAVYVNRRPGELSQAVLAALPELAARKPRPALRRRLPAGAGACRAHAEAAAILNGTKKIRRAGVAFVHSAD